MEERAALLARVSADHGTEIKDPATGEVIGWVAFDAHAEELAYVVSREQGKTMNGLGGRYEAAGCAAWVRATASTPLPVEVLVDDGQSRAELHYRPIGVVGAITPWNWPMIIACWQIAPALRMGNTVVQKPSEYTTLTGLAIAAVLNEALPPGVLTAVTGAGDVGDALVRDPRVGKVMFTGSVKTGMKVIEASAGNMPRLTLELGGNDAAIVLPDVDPQAIAEGLFWGAFINNGQTCAAMKRLYVPDAIYDEVVDALAALAAKIPMGVGLDEGNVLGPLQNQMQWNVVNRLVEDAKVRGARVVMGGDPDTAAPGYFYPKTLIADIDNAAPLVQEEQFGPALPIIRYTDLEQAVEWATTRPPDRSNAAPVLNEQRSDASQDTSSASSSGWPTWGKIRETIGPDSTVSHTRIEWLLVDDPWFRGRRS